MTQTNNERELIEQLAKARRELQQARGFIGVENPFVDMPELDKSVMMLEAYKSQNEQQEAVGEVKIVLMGANDVSAIEWSDNYRPKVGDKLYTSPHKQAMPEGWVKIKKDAERYRWLREVSRDPDESSPHCVVTEEVLEKGKPAKMVSYLVFDEKLDAEIEKMINASPTNTEVGE